MNLSLNGQLFDVSQEFSPKWSQKLKCNKISHIVPNSELYVMIHYYAKRDFITKKPFITNKLRVHDWIQAQ